MYKNILIPTDGSELAGKAVKHGTNLAKYLGAKVTLLTVTTPYHIFTLETKMVEDTPAEYTKEVQADAAKLLCAKPLDISKETLIKRERYLNPILFRAHG
ncbi:MAG: universal stress protein [Candidatus Sulfotelmatobacter sp.]|jgi:nucleotide-binding universal stress UspA family protein